MTSSLTLALRTTQSGLLTNQSALDSVANNIANVNTEGYSRKIVNTEQRVVEGQGAGVQISEITRAVDENLLKSLRNELTNLNQLSSQTDYFTRMQDLFGRPADDSSISHTIGEFISAIELLAVSPDKNLEQSELVRTAQDMVNQFAAMSENIQTMRLEADQVIEDIADEITLLASTIGNINDTIIKNGAVGRDTTDLRDQRDMALDDLSKLIDIQYFQKSDGDVVVFTKGGRTLVDNVPATITHSSASSISATTTHGSGDISGIYIGAQIAGNDITNEIRNGKLKGLIELRDETLPNIQSQLDELSAEIRDAFNQIHNRGTAFPGAQSMSGERIFIDSSVQTISLGDGSDVRISLFDSSGDQSATTTLSTIMIDPTLGSAGYPATTNLATGPWTIDEVTETIEDWLQANGASQATVSVSSSGKVEIDLNEPSLGLSFRDEVDAGTVYNSVTFNDNGASADTITASSGTFDGVKVGQVITISGTGSNDGTYTVTAVSADGSTISVATGSFTAESGTTMTMSSVPAPKGSAHSDATIRFNADGDTSTGNAGSTTGMEEEVMGFSYFFGLNNFIVDSAGENIFESDVQTSSFTASAATLNFRDDSTGSLGTVSITSGMTLDEIATEINDNISELTASVIPDGAGYRLRIAHDDGNNFVVSQDGSSDSLLTDIGMHRADVRMAGLISVRSDIEAEPGKIAGGVMEWDSNLGAAGEYHLSVGSDGTAQSLATTFAANNQFNKAGGIAALNMRFDDYASLILSKNASQADTNERRKADQEVFTQSLQNKSDSVRGVNIDEEMSNLILFEQAYSAAARVVNTIQRMFDALESAIR